MMHYACHYIEVTLTMLAYLAFCFRIAFRDCLQVPGFAQPEGMKRRGLVTLDFRLSTLDFRLSTLDFRLWTSLRTHAPDSRSGVRWTLGIQPIFKLS